MLVYIYHIYVDNYLKRIFEPLTIFEPNLRCCQKLESNNEKGPQCSTNLRFAQPYAQPAGQEGAQSSNAVLGQQSFSRDLSRVSPVTPGKSSQQNEKRGRRKFVLW